MPVDYSKWDALELSDDSDIEVHPNVDKRSFIRAKQNQIHAERQQRKNHIETLKYERIINEALIKRISSLLSSLKAHAAEAESRNPAEVAFRAVMESASSLDPKDDQPPPRPAGVHNAEEQLPTYTKMMATLLDQVNKALDEKKVEQDKRYMAMVDEIGEHLQKVTDLQKELLTKLKELEKEEGRKITSEGIHTGFDTSFVNKSAPSTSSSGKKEAPSSQVELLNPNFKPSSSKVDEVDGDASSGDDDEANASPTAKKFGEIKTGEYRESLAYLSQHPEILSEHETDGLLVLGFDAQLEGREVQARNYVHQALLLQYCRALGRDGVALFFKRIMTPGHQAQEVFLKDVRETYGRIKTRAAEINVEREKEAEGGAVGVEQIQLHAVEPGTVINIRIPPTESQDPADKKGREIFETFTPEMKKALEKGSLAEVNKVLGRMKVPEAEDVVGKLSEAGILSLEEEIIDATTDEGKQHLEQLREEAREEAKHTATEDPE